MKEEKIGWGERRREEKRGKETTGGEEKRMINPLSQKQTSPICYKKLKGKQLNKQHFTRTSTSKSSTSTSKGFTMCKEAVRVLACM